MMHRLLPAVLIVLSGISTRLLGQDLLTREKIGTTFTHFYLRPDSNTLKLLIRSIQNNREAREALPSAPVVGFFAAILLSDSPNKEVAARMLNSLTDRFELFDVALRFGKTQDTIFNWTNRKPDSNDLIWGAYFATGETRYLGKLLEETKWSQRDDSIAVFMTGASAKWSLASNLRQHESIREYLTSRETSGDENSRKMAKQILERDPAEIRAEVMKQLEKMKTDKKP